jgi:hypothetical protein
MDGTIFTDENSVDSRTNLGYPDGMTSNSSNSKGGRRMGDSDSEDDLNTRRIPNLSLIEEGNEFDLSMRSITMEEDLLRIGMKKDKKVIKKDGCCCSVSWWQSEKDWRERESDRERDRETERERERMGVQEWLLYSCLYLLYLEKGTERRLAFLSDYQTDQQDLLKQCASPSQASFLLDSDPLFVSSHSWRDHGRGISILGRER